MASSINKQAINIYLEDLEFIIDFLNKQPLTMNIHDLIGLASLYATFMADKGFDLKLINYTELNTKLIDGLTPDAPQSVIDDKRTFFSELQQHCREIINLIIEGIKSGEEFVIQTHKPIEISIKRVEKQTFYRYSLMKQDVNDTLDFNYEKSKLDVVFLNMIDNISEYLPRLKLCAKPDCGRYFLKPNDRKKEYCSPQCGGSVRQAKYVKEKKTDQEKQ